MKNLVIALIFLAGCTTLRRIDIPPRNSDPVPSPTPTVIVSVPTPSPIPYTGMKFQCDDSCTPFEMSRLKKAELKGNEVIRSECFRDFWLKTRILCLQNGEMACPNVKASNAELYSDLIAVNKTIPVHYYYRRTSTIGYRNVGEPDVYFNRKFHDDYGVCETASNAFHEGTHSALEWSHTSNYYYDRDYSPPYRLNTGFDKCCKE